MHHGSEKTDSVIVGNNREGIDVGTLAILSLYTTPMLLSPDYVGSPKLNPGWIVRPNFLSNGI
jgi:hypothetical protein